jgi:SMODS and SLOG-associating 2TM effector domain family 4
MESIIHQVRETYTQVVYAHKAHEESSKILLFRMRLIENLQIVLTIVTAAAVGCALFALTTLALIVGASLATLLFLSMIFLRKSDFGILAEKHAELALRLGEIVESYVSFLTDIHDMKLKREQIVFERNRLQEELNSCRGVKPLEGGYKSARKILRAREGIRFLEAEVESLLPVYLQKAID